MAITGGAGNKGMRCSRDPTTSEEAETGKVPPGYPPLSKNIRLPTSTPHHLYILQTILSTFRFAATKTGHA